MDKFDISEYYCYNITKKEIAKGRKLYNKFTQLTDELVKSWKDYHKAKQRKDAKKCAQLITKYSKLENTSTKARLAWCTYANSKLKNSKDLTKTFEERFAKKLKK